MVRAAGATLSSLLLALLVGCGRPGDVSPEPVATTTRAATGMADEASCVECHASQANAHRLSAHALTSSLPSPATVKGRFGPDGQRMSTADPNVSFLMEAKDGAFFQTALVTTPTGTRQRTERIDLVVGSGRKGQTYLYWNGDSLFELPVSTWTKTGEWMNSPGYPDGTANFDRGISDRCLECHATSFTSLAPPRHRFARDSVLAGIACQRCHGPAGEHVARFRAAAAGQAAVPADTAIVHSAKLSRERQMDLCALCHAGAGTRRSPPLSFVAGDELSRHLVVASASPDAPPDPHGSQVQSLQLSRCYQASATLTCTTCHDVHQPRRAAETFAANCLACHRTEACGELSRRGPTLAPSCIDCHMPLQTTEKIVMRVGGRRVQPEVRSHRIGLPPRPAPDTAPSLP